MLSLVTLLRIIITHNILSSETTLDTVDRHGQILALPT